MIKHCSPFKSLPAALFLACVSFQAQAENFVGVCPAESVSRSTNIKLMASVDAKLDESPSSAYHSYRLGIEIPMGVVPDIHEGQELDVSLRVLHQQKNKAVITSIKGQSIDLLLSGQVQQLKGQVLTVQVPLKRDGLYLVPPESIYSPRGSDTKVFIVANNNALDVPVGVIEAMENGQVLVSSKMLRHQKVICAGMNNIVAGEPVIVISKVGGDL